MTDDLISRQAAIDLFPNDALEWDTNGGYIAPHLARRIIEELPSAQQWIPVSDRLPEPFKSVLITFEHTQYATRIPHRVVTVGIGFYNGKKWSQAISALQSYKDTKVLAWMPLPDIWEES